MFTVIGLSLIAIVAAFTICVIWLGTPRRTSSSPAKPAVAPSGVELAQLRAEVAELRRRLARPEPGPEERVDEAPEGLRRSG